MYVDLNVYMCWALIIQRTIVPSVDNVAGLLFANFQIVSFDNQVEGCGEIREVSTTPSMQNKGPHSLLSSSGNYEAQKNLNGFFRETKSSDKTNTPFVTPMRTKRSHAGKIHLTFYFPDSFFFFVCLLVLFIYVIHSDFPDSCFSLLYLTI